MLHSDRESTITAERVGVCLCVGFHLSANLIDTLSRIPISADGKITPANILYLYIASSMCDTKGEKQESEKESTREKGDPSPPSLFI